MLLAVKSAASTSNKQRVAAFSTGHAIGLQKFAKKDIIQKFHLVRLARHGDEAVGGGVCA